MITMPPAGAATGVTLVTVTPPEVTAPSAADVGRFELALAQPRITIEPLDAAPPAAIEPAIATPGALGERILTTVERMRVGYQEGMSRVDATLHQEALRGPDMMRLLIETMRMSLQQEMMSKMVGRTTQNLDQLLKGQ